MPPRPDSRQPGGAGHALRRAGSGLVNESQWDQDSARIAEVGASYKSRTGNCAGRSISFSPGGDATAGTVPAGRFPGQHRGSVRAGRNRCRGSGVDRDRGADRFPRLAGHGRPAVAGHAGRPDHPPQLGSESGQTVSLCPVHAVTPSPRATRRPHRRKLHPGLSTTCACRESRPRLWPAATCEVPRRYLPATSSSRPAPPPDANASGPPVRRQPGSLGHLAICQVMPSAESTTLGFRSPDSAERFDPRQARHACERRIMHVADEQAKAVPGCPFTTRVGTAELAVNDPGRCIVEARSFTLDGSIDLRRCGDSSWCRAWSALLKRVSRR